MKKRITSIITAICMLATCAAIQPKVKSNLSEVNAAEGSVRTSTMSSNSMVNELMDNYTSFILVRHRQTGGSHYAYTEGVSEELVGTNAPDGTESNFFPGSEMVLLELSKSGNTVTRKETVLLESKDGVLRDPDVSEDGTKVLFSWKKNRNDDFHLYEYNLQTRLAKQLTFGSGVADIEPKYLATGKIVFCSTRDIQTVDCWITPVSNIFTCDGDGKNIERLGYDQVHTTYPTVTTDGRILYTRWDYSDRNQMYVQGVFQMFHDGTGQTELYGNNANFPTTLLHTREIPGEPSKYISIASGHHVYQAGKLVIVDTSKGRNSKDAIDFVVDDGSERVRESIDNYGQSGALYKFPFAVNSNLFLAAYCSSGWASDRTYTPFGIYLFDASGNKTELIPGDSQLPCSQIVPVKTRQLFERTSMVNHAKSTGTYYCADVYAGPGLKGVARGTAKYLRVVAIEFRQYAIGATQGVGWGTSDPYTPVSTGNGAWDVKRIIGIVPIEEDGSVMFDCPSETPVYFQILNADGELIQTMRTWSTLMPGESFSCVGCHTDKNMAPSVKSTTTMAMAKGVQKLQKDLWMTTEDYKDYDPYEDSKGFDYLTEVQPIFDNSCIKCHSDVENSYEQIGVTAMNGEDGSVNATPLALDAKWKYSTKSSQNSNWYAKDFNDSSWDEGYAPFGTANCGPGQIGTVWNTDKIYMRTEFTVTKYQKGILDMSMTIACLSSPKVYINGTLVYENNGSMSAYTTTKLTSAMKKALVAGKNTIAVTASNSGSNEHFVGLSIGASLENAGNSVEVIGKGGTWKYRMSGSNDAASNWNQIGFDDSGWAEATAPFGDRTGYATSWTGDNKYIWIRKTFNIDNLNDYKGCSISLNTFYDDNPYFYLNGHLVYRDTEGNPWVDGYTKINLGSDISQYLVQGKNVLAIACSNDTGGRQIDAALTLTKVKLLKTEMFEKGSEWKYQMSTSDNVASGWNQVSFNDSGWNTAKAPFGDRGGYVTSWTGNNTYIWLRKKFTIDDLSEFNNAQIIMNTFFDDTPEFYLNGNLIYSNSGWVDAYTELNLGAGYTQYLREGENVLAIKCKNTSGGRQIDTDFVLATGAYSEKDLIPVRDTNWKYRINSNPGNEWMKESYNDSGWNTGNAPFGSGSNSQTNWSGDNSDIWLRKTFTINNINDVKNMKMYLNIFYDEDPTVYINGTKVYSAEGYLTEYRLTALPTEYTKLLKQGTNTIAIHAHNSTGGLFIDSSLTMKSVSAVPFSLEDVNVVGKRMKKYFPLSYLVLTGSYVTGGVNWVANSSNTYTNFVSSMSQCDILNPYQYGSTKSNIINKLKNGHGNLSEAEIRTIATWIDLEVPCYGSYDANGNNTWGGNEIRWAEQHTNKHSFYDMLEKFAKKDVSGLLDKNNITINFNGSNGQNYSITDDGLVTLYVNKSYSSGDKVTITLPQGEKYLMFSMNSMMGEQLIYCPNGTFSYTVPSATNVFPSTWTFYQTNTITARLPLEKELTSRRNIAKNIYDLDSGTGSYPHATAKSAHNNLAEFQERNAIDGFTANTSHGNYPYQSWGPSNNDGYQWMQVDFGHEAYVNEVDIYIRADFPHDTHYISATLEFSNGSQKEVVLKKTKKAQKITFDTVKTSYVKIKDLVPSDSSTSLWEGITEFEVYGTEKLPAVVADTTWTVGDNNIIYKVPVGTSVAAFTGKFNYSVNVTENGQTVTDGLVKSGMKAELTAGANAGKVYTVVVRGDVSGDGAVTVTDVVKLRNLIKTGNASAIEIKALDMNLDGVLNANDISTLKKLIMDED
ncbi:MAG: hypothetical protein E7254_01770 [Lachnospiraceae bacterium]|nr:hypothetical protein [Lachnospiraceae bacterium]